MDGIQCCLTMNNEEDAEILPDKLSIQRNTQTHCRLINSSDDQQSLSSPSSNKQTSIRELTYSPDLMTSMHYNIDFGVKLPNQEFMESELNEESTVHDGNNQLELYHKIKTDTDALNHDNDHDDDDNNGNHREGQIPSIHFQFPDSDSENFTAEVDGSSGKLTLWQFLLELLLSNKYEHIIRWTNKRGEFILVQAEIVAKLWGMRKDKNHRMNYDKLSRALRYYYQKNIIRKVHGRKFVYQFIGLKHLIKFCCTPSNSTSLTLTKSTETLTTPLTSTITAPIATEEEEEALSSDNLQETLKQLNKLASNSKSMHDNNDDGDDEAVINTTVNPSLYCSAKSEDMNNRYYQPKQHQHKEWNNLPHNNSNNNNNNSNKFCGNQLDCKYSSSVSTHSTPTITTTVPSTNINNTTHSNVKSTDEGMFKMLSTEDKKVSKLDSIHLNSIYPPMNLDITSISTLINTCLNKQNNSATTQSTYDNNNNNNGNNNNNFLFNYLNNIKSIFSEQNQSKASNGLNELTEFITSWAYNMTSSQNNVINFNDYQITRNPNSLYNGLNQFTHPSTEQIIHLEQQKHQGIPSTVDTNSTNTRNDSTMLYKDDYYFKNYKNINNPLMNSISLNHTDFINSCDTEVWNRHKDTWMNTLPNSTPTPTPPPPPPLPQTTTRKETTSEKLPYVQQFNKTERCRSPNCQCSCHLPTTRFEHNNYSTTQQNSNHHTPYSLSIKDNIMMKKINDVLYRQNNLDELPTKLHNERHTINMKRLGEQLTRVNRLNAAVNYLNSNSNNNNNNSDPTKFNNQRCEYNVNYDDSNNNIRDYHKLHTKNPPPSELKTPPTVSTTYNNNNNNKSNITSPLGLSSTTPMSDSKCVWMPVPVTMLNSWFNLLSNITCPNNNDNTNTTTNNNINSSNSVNQSTFITPCTTSSSSSLSSLSSPFTSSLYNQ
uniref:ETS domain-containing protein n=1 Tax=Trichobilharzia regenti TaxID=157069 RepID=A0AA85IUM6_TRIRE|nr:unnamed protein product [Trichobilharzia regenti]